LIAPLAFGGKNKRLTP